MSVYQIIDKPTPYQWARPTGEAGRVSWIAVHTPESSGRARATVAYLTGPTNTGRVGYHELVDGVNGLIYRMAPPHRWVGQAGIGTRVPGTTVRNVQCNYRMWSISLDNVAGQRPPELAVVIAAQRVADMIVELGLPDAGVVLGHRELSTTPGRRSDPTRVSMIGFREMVADALARRRTV